MQMSLSVKQEQKVHTYTTHTGLTFLSNLTNFNQVLELMPDILDHASIHSEMNIENVFF